MPTSPLDIIDTPCLPPPWISFTPNVYLHPGYHSHLPTEKLLTEASHFMPQTQPAVSLTMALLTMALLTMADPARGVHLSAASMGGLLRFANQ